ncbi:MAG: D-alanyl-D-alanine carboxypeptidase/D-alanyl-D-alanine-endopeptidase [Fibrobacterota bacterium]|jgi:D-alanyl-D-alanine carboxypeptidase/D-alanyl-D-alanine-endopeptidase (penicillin-binding protein 4)
MTFLLLACALLSSDPVTPILSALPQGTVHQRMDAASRMLMGRPYLLGPMGEGDASLGEAKPRVRLDSLDCVTFIEQSEAFARSQDTASFRRILDSIRYEKAKVRWETRNHWMECGWFSSNASRVRLLNLPGSVEETRTLGLKAFFAAHGIARKDSNLTLRYLPRDRAIEWLRNGKNLTRIHGVGLVGKVPSIFLLHTGFLMPGPDGIGLRHASQTGTVKQEPASLYLESKAKFKGIVVWEYLP